MSESILLPRIMYIEEFLPLKGREFLADCEPRAAVLELVEVAPGARAPNLARQSFTLIFRSTPRVLLVTGMYKIRCGDFGPEVVYLEQTAPPAAPDAPAGYYYQAVFN